MNYRHAFHAGNFADVMKHIALVAVIEHLRKKDKPFRVIDTHAGAGLYDLSSSEAKRTGEWREGIDRVRLSRQVLTASDADQLIARYLALVSDCAGAHSYPGSPKLARELLRYGDKLQVNELHPDTHKRLGQLFDRDRQTVVTSIDGWQALKAALPPKERRAVILIDPPFEERGEFERLTEGLIEGHKRFATGHFLLWYPVKDEQIVRRFHNKLAQTGIADLWCAELKVRAVGDPGILPGAGLIIANPPYRFVDTFAQVLNWLATRLAVGPGATGRVRRIA